MCILLPFNPQPDAGPKLGWKKYIYIGRASSGRASGLKTFAKKKSCERDGTNQKSQQLLETVLYVPTMVLCGFGPQHDSGMGAFVYFIILTSHLYPSSPFVRTTLPFDVTWQSRSRNCHLGFSHMWEVNDLQPQSINSVLPVQVLNPFSLLLLRSTDKQNELELPCPVPKSRERKRRQGQQPQQQQGGGVMTQIGGVKKGTNNRFGVKTDQEELLSKVRGHSINRGIFFFLMDLLGWYALQTAFYNVVFKSGPGGHQQMGAEYLQGGRALSQPAPHMHHVRHLSGQCHVGKQTNHRLWWIKKENFCFYGKQWSAFLPLYIFFSWHITDQTTVTSLVSFIS